MNDVEIFCDGSCSGNPGPGGWACLIRRGKQERVYSGECSDTTNNRMELMAAISSLEMLKDGEQAILYSDSKYVVEGINKWVKGWVKKGWVTSSNSRVLNRDLWERLLALTKKNQVKFNWIRGHSTYEIDLVDRMAKEQTKA